MKCPSAQSVLLLSIIIMKMIKLVSAVADVVNIVRRCFVSLVCVKPLCYWSLGFFPQFIVENGSLDFTNCFCAEQWWGENTLTDAKYPVPLCGTCEQWCDDGKQVLMQKSISDNEWCYFLKRIWGKRFWNTRKKKDI